MKKLLVGLLFVATSAHAERWFEMKNDAGAADMKERCAKVCERDDSMRWSGAADAIRALGDEK